MRLLNWLQNWYTHELINNKNIGLNEIISIGTIDNPGWYVRIDLNKTKFSKKSFKDINIDNGDDDWVLIKLKDGVFEGVGDKKKLIYILYMFKEWSLSGEFDDISFKVKYDSNDLLQWLQNEWFCSLDFGGDYMYDYNVSILSRNDGWKVKIEVIDTYLENKDISPVYINKNIDDWVNVEVKNGNFCGDGDITKLVFIIETFRNWSEQFKD